MKLFKTIKKGNSLSCKISIILLSLLLLLSIVIGIYNYLIPNSVSCFALSDIPTYLGTTFSFDDSGMQSVGAVSVGSGQYKLFGAIPIKEVKVSSLKDLKVYLGGMPFGIKFYTNGVIVVGFDNEKTNPAFCAGLRLYDVIKKVNGQEVNGSININEIIEGSNGQPITLTFTRAGKESSITFDPTYSESEKKYTCGIWLKDSGAGIGTVTFVVPESYVFGGLGHGICDSETGELISISGGSITGVTLNGVVKGKSGTPGELKGYFNSSKSGAVISNTDCGVFGVLGDTSQLKNSETVPIGLKNEIKEGKATILCTLDDNIRKEYSVEISGINKNATGNKCFTVKITDPELINATGGIVQGMSGSPIIQNGKLVGAVTHVLINDPCKGYGIFIENMLVNVNNSALPKAA